MIGMKDLEEFEDWLTSGRLEDEFEYSPEDRRGEVLELLEKFMDVAEKADEAATKLIFKGGLGALAGVKPEGSGGR